MFNVHFLTREGFLHRVLGKAIKVLRSIHPKCDLCKGPHCEICWEMQEPEFIFEEMQPEHWEQVRLNGGPPCFMEDSDGTLCGRAMRWQGHPEMHPYLSLSEFLKGREQSTAAELKAAEFNSDCYEEGLQRCAAELKAAQERIKELEAKVPHNGDGSCEHCGKVPAIDIPTSLCDECRDGVKRAQSAELQVTRLRAALEGLLKYSPLSGDMALMIRACQCGGKRADSLIEHYRHLDEFQDAAREALEEK